MPLLFQEGRFIIKAPSLCLRRGLGVVCLVTGVSIKGFNAHGSEERRGARA
jgi:hypothetical protein